MNYDHGQEVNCMPRTGRPRLENPRSEGIFIRLTKDEKAAVLEYAENHDQTITQTLVDGFLLLQSLLIKSQGENEKNFRAGFGYHK